jgi:hypothetical protein
MEEAGFVTGALQRRRGWQGVRVFTQRMLAALHYRPPDGRRPRASIGRPLSTRSTTIPPPSPNKIGENARHGVRGKKKAAKAARVSKGSSCRTEDHNPPSLRFSYQKASERRESED